MSAQAHRARVAAERFERLYADSADPWDYCTSDYERGSTPTRSRRSARRRYRRALEVGCSIGVFTARSRSAARASSPSTSPRAPSSSRKSACAVCENVELVPASFPERGARRAVGSASSARRSSTTSTVARSKTRRVADAPLEPEGTVLAVSWRGPARPSRCAAMRCTTCCRTGCAAGTSLDGRQARYRLDASMDAEPRADRGGRPAQRRGTSRALPPGAPHASCGRSSSCLPATRRSASTPACWRWRGSAASAPASLRGDRGARRLSRRTAARVAAVPSATPGLAVHVIELAVLRGRRAGAPPRHGSRLRAAARRRATRRSDREHRRGQRRGRRLAVRASCELVARRSARDRRRHRARPARGGGAPRRRCARRARAAARWSGCAVLAEEPRIAPARSSTISSAARRWA